MHVNTHIYLTKFNPERICLPGKFLQPMTKCLEQIEMSGMQVFSTPEKSHKKFKNHEIKKYWD